MTTTITPSAPAHEQACAHCGAALGAEDRFCAACGGARPVATVSAPPSGPTADRVAEAAAAHRARAGVELSLNSPFCRACGADHAPGAGVCAQCERVVGVLEPVPLEPLATVHLLRRKLLKRPAVRIGTDGTQARLLLESGEITSLALDELPPPAPFPLPEPDVPLRTTQGTLVRLAEACAAGAIKQKWQAGVLVEAALAATTEDAGARAFALDLLALGRPDLLGRLPLTDTERAWLRAVVAAEAGEHAAVVAAIGELPARGYRPKLALALGAWRGAGDGCSVLRPHLAAYADEEPLAALLARALGFTEPDPHSTIRGAHAVCATVPLPELIAAQLAAAGAVVAGERPPADIGGDHLETSARALLALASGAPGLVGAADVRRLPLAVVDDLLDAGALSAESALNAGVDEDTASYLRARLAPERLSDAEVRTLEHADEELRRAFRRGDKEALDAAGEHPAARHYATLEALRRNKPRMVEPDQVRPDARPVVDALLALAGAKADGTSLFDELSDLLIEDPTVWPVVAEIAGSTGLAATPALRERYPAFAEWLALAQARDFLYLGAWQQAVDAAGRVLELAELEDVRDEALNLKACGLHYLGRDAEAVEALEQALDGAYSEGLLANMGIVASQLAPEIAAKYLGTLIDEAPTTAMRTAAAHRALTIWSQTDTSTWRNSDNSPLPDAFQDALRRLIAVPDLKLDDFRSFARVLAVNDGEWFTDARNLGASPHRDTLEGRYYLARARDLHAMIEVMGPPVAAGTAPPWLLQERDSLRDAAVEILFENLDEPDSTFGSIALAMADKGVLANEYDQVLFTLLGIASISYHLSERHEEVADRIVRLVLDTRARWQRLDGEQRTLVEPMVELATRRVAINRMLARDREIGRAIDLFNAALDRGQYAAPGTYQYAEAMRQVALAASMARSARDDLVPWLPIVDHDGVREDINKSVETTRELEHRCLQILN